MGNALKCFSPKNPFPSFLSSSSSKRTNKDKKENLDHESNQEYSTMNIQEHALAAALLFHQRNAAATTTAAAAATALNRSTSVAYPSSSGANKQGLSKSSSYRQLSRSDTLLHLVINQDFNANGLETNHFVLVHGGGFGACWYKTMTLLQEAGFEVDAIDLTGSGVNSFDTHNITSLAQYVKPLIDVLDKLGDGKKVILVGHDFGGTCISYVMELFPSKVAKAVFICATMLTNGESTFDLFTQQAGSNDMMQKAHIFLYKNGKDKPPTAIDLDKTLLRDLLFSQSPTKDVALASVSMRPTPFAPVLEKLFLSNANYGSIRRFYIKTQEDFAISVEAQENMINKNPPEQVFQLKGSDHSPFLSKPQGLHRLLVEIARIPQCKV